jgi:HK97 family phage major capsid protein
MMAARSKATNAVTQIDLSAKDVKNYSLMRAINAVVHKDWKRAGFELECHQEIATRTGKVVAESNFFVPLDIQNRDITAATASNGGYLVQTTNVSFIELLRNRSVALSLGATRLPGLTGNVAIPKQTGAATGYWLATEATAITESQQTFGQLLLSPKNVGAYTEISRQLTIQSSPSAEQLVMTDLARVIGLAVDSAILSGAGTGGAPTGITATSGIGTFTGTTLGYAGLLAAQTAVAAANVSPGATGGYATTPAVAALLMARQRFTSTDTPLWSGNLWDGTVAGFKGMSSNQMATATALFGDWSAAVLAEWGVLELEVNPYANFQAGLIGVRAFYSVDVGVRYAGAFALGSSIT